MAMLLSTRLTLLVLVVLFSALNTAKASTGSFMSRDTLPSLLRLNRDGDKVSADLSHYMHWNCTGSGSDRECTFIEPTQEEIQDGGSTDHFASYLDGVFMYAGYNFAGAMLLILLTFFWVSIGLFCLMLTHCCGCKVKAKSHISRKYRDGISTFCLVALIVLIFVITLLGYIVGTAKLFDFIGSMSDAPEGAMDLYSAELATSLTAFVGISSSVVVPLLTEMNSTLHEGVTLGRVYEDLSIINQTFYSLPKVEDLREYIDDVVNITEYLGIDIETIVSNLDDLNLNADNVSTSADSLSEDLVSLDSDLFNITAAINNSIAVIENISAVNDLLYGDGANTGLVDSAINDLRTIKRDDDLAEGFPSEWRFDETYTDTAERLITGQFNNNPATYSDLLIYTKNLTDIYIAVAVLPDYSETANTLRQINDTINSVIAPSGIGDNLIDSLNELESALSSLGDTDVYVDQVDYLYDTVQALDLTHVTSSISSLESLLDSAIDTIDAVYETVAAYGDALPTIIPVLYDLLVVQTEPVNRTLFKLPDNTSEQFYTINETLWDGISQARELLALLNDSRTSITDVNISDYLAQVNKAQNSLDDKIGSFNFSDLSTQMSDTKTALNVSFTEYVTKIQTTQSQYSNSTLSADLVNSLDTFQVFRATLENALQRVASPLNFSNSSWDTPYASEGDYLLMAKGVCDTDRTIYCSSDSECATTCISKGTYRCSSNGDTAQLVTPCIVDGDCTPLGGGSYCLMDQNRTANVSSLLYFWGTDGDVTFPNASQLIAKLTKINENGYNTSETLDQLEQAFEDAQGVDISAYQQDLQDVQDGLQDFNLSDVNATLSDTLSTINDLDTSSFNESLQSVQDEQDDIIGSVGTVMTFLDGFMDFLYEPDQLETYLEEMSAESLSIVLDSQGDGPVVQAVAGTMDVIRNTIDDLFRILESEGVSLDLAVINVTDETEAYAVQLDRASANPFKTRYTDIDDHGSMYFMFKQSSSLTSMIVNADNADAEDGTVYGDKDGKAYGDGRFCFTDDCWDTTNAVFTQDAFVFNGIDFTTSLQNVLALAWLFIALIFIMAVVTFVCPLCTKKSSSCKRSCPATCMLILIIICLPWYFIINAFLFPMAILISDGCTTGPKALKTYVDAYGDDMCTGQLGGTGTNTECNLKTTFGDYSLEVNLDIPSIVNGLLGSCSGKDPFKTPLRELEEQFTSGTLYNMVDNELRTRSEFENVRNPVRDVVRNAASNAETVMASYIADVADITDCESVAKVFNDMTSPLCNDFAGAFGWFTAMIYLASWTLCCIGIPAGCFAQHNAKWTKIEDITNGYGSEDSDCEHEVDDESVSTVSENGTRTHYSRKSRGRSDSAEKRRAAAIFLRQSDSANADGGDHYESGDEGADVDIAAKNPPMNPNYQPVSVDEQANPSAYNQGDVELVQAHNSRSVAPADYRRVHQSQVEEVASDKDDTVHYAEEV